MRHEPVPRFPLRLVHAVVLVVAAALFACWGHLALVATLRHVVGHFSWKWWLRDQVLLSSVGYLFVFAVLSALPVALYLIWPRVVTLTRLAAFEAGLAALSILLVFDRVAPAALVVVALGVGVETLRRTKGRDATVIRGARWIAATGLAMTVSVVAVSRTLRASAEASAMPAPAGTPQGTPNVLLLILDTVRASSLGLYGGPVDNTPFLSDRATRGVVFENAYSTAPWTLPSHASIFTGHYASHTAADWRTPLGSEYPTLAEVLRGRGLATGGFVANTVSGGFPTGLARGFMHYEDTPYSVDEFLLATTLTQTVSFVDAQREWRATRWMKGAIRHLLRFDLKSSGNYIWHDKIPADQVADDFLGWQATLGDRPFFAFLNLFDAHAPYLPPESFRTMYGEKGSTLDRYLGAIRYMDGVIERTLRVLERRGALRNTIVVVTSDHGEAFGEHSLVGHGNGLYREQLRVPLVILNAPGLPAGLRVRAPVSLRDLGATILVLGGAADGAPLGGVSLLPRGEGTAGACEPASPVVAEVSRGINVDPRSFAGRADQKSVVDDTVQVIQSSLGTVQLYEQARDPLQLRDLAERPESRSAAAALLERTLRGRGITWDGRGRPTRCDPREATPPT